MAAHQDELIAKHLVGHRILDVGAGYGLLTKRLRERGFVVTATDPHRESRELAKLWHGIDVLADDIYRSALPSQGFDTVVLREVGEHLEFERALPEIGRLARRAVVLFQTNVSPLVRAMRWAVGHEEFRSPPIDHYVDMTERAGFVVDTVRYTDVLAFPLSGGFVTRSLVPDQAALWPWIFRLENAAAGAARALHLERQICWRVLVRGVRPDRHSLDR